MTDTTRPDGVEAIMELAESYCEKRHTLGAPEYNIVTARARDTLRAATIAALTAPASKPAGVTDKVIADAIPVTATILTTGPRNKVCMTRSELHQFAAALSHAKPAEDDHAVISKAFLAGWNGCLHKKDANEVFAELRAALAAQHPSQSAGEPVAEWKQSPRGTFLELRWKHGYVAACGDKLYLASPPPTDAARASDQVARIVHLRADREKRIYIAGPMTGLPEFNFPAFNAKAVELRAEGWHVENPAEHGHVKGARWADYLRWDISRIVTCGAIYLLPDWETSKGAQLEVYIGKALGLTFHGADAARASGEAPIDMVLHCPACGMQHIDRPDPPSQYAGMDGTSNEWTCPPHRSHLCRPEDGGCGHIWRPADVPTNGVAAVMTKGKADSPIATPAEPDAARIEADRRDAEGGPTDDQLWNLRGLSPFDATTETREEFIIRARAALAAERKEQA